MRIALTALLTATLALSACQSRLNPVNWFGSDEAAVREVAETGEVNPLIPSEETGGLFAKGPAAPYGGTPIYNVKSMEVLRVPEGALITATGVATVHGVFDVRLLARNNGRPVSGVLTYDLLGLHPSGAPGGGSEQSREVTAAVVATNQELAGVRTIVVQSATNARQSRR
ncbi:hypothetical protein [Shimia abyssi]|uniref:Lipoprotein n=1 Tax=Shimia abyssi TaxID=1662395 RepID=A0A2P8F6F1_9RHOB|nr:hypothetical protein [Shimia abyssi]PSL17289.1 hypothetical protein CLV88_11960 [Shimia abyssi]